MLFLVTATFQQRSIDATTHVQLSDPSDVADVMILFEETDNIKSTLASLLNAFVVQITDNFKQKGMK